MANPIFKFEDAERVQCKASIMIEGLPGSGKSGLALMIAYYLANEDWSKVSDIDTENKSVNLFVGIPFTTGAPVGKFKVAQLTEDIGYKPSHYLTLRGLAKKQYGALAVIEDSISHAWQYKGGLLDMVSQAKERTKNKNDKYAAWGDEEVMAEKNRLLSLIRDPDVHVITTVRVKEKLDYEEDAQGKKKLVSLGDQQIMQADLKYEPDLVLSMVKPGHGTESFPVVTCTKTRYAIFEKGEEYVFTPELCKQLKAYLEEGADPLAILEQQRQEYVQAVTDHLNTHKNKVTIWSVMKDDAGYKDTPLKDIPLEGLKALYLQLTT